MAASSPHMILLRPRDRSEQRLATSFERRLWRARKSRGGAAPDWTLEKAMHIALAADHAGYLMKDELADWLREQGHEVSDLGTNGPESVDYPRFGKRIAEAVANGQVDRGIAVCGSGIGISIAVNRNPRCRCARVDDPLSAQLAREHNDANVLALGARLIGSDMAKACVAAFLDTDFAGGRHQRRVDQLSHELQDSD